MTLKSINVWILNSLNNDPTSLPGAFKQDLSKFGHVILQCYNKSFYSGTVLPTNSYITLEWPVQVRTPDYANRERSLRSSLREQRKSRLTCKGVCTKNEILLVKRCNQ